MCIKHFSDLHAKPHITNVSRQSPNWFSTNAETTKKEIDNFYVQNTQSLHVLSRFRDWITVTPKSKNRRNPLENAKLVNIFLTLRNPWKILRSARCGCR